MCCQGVASRVRLANVIGLHMCYFIVALPKFMSRQAKKMKVCSIFKIYHGILLKFYGITIQSHS